MGDPAPGSGIVTLDVQGDVAVIHLGGDDEKITVLTEPRLLSLDVALDKVRASSSVRGLIIIGPRFGAFCAGADINQIKAITKADQGRRLAERGQAIFNKLEQLSIPTVAAIHGTCVGGGCEMVLACRYRIATNSSESKIGLPEIKLGILPGFGGTQRLPRLVGLPRAFDIILQGKTIPAKQARAYGLVDELVDVAGSDRDAAYIALEKRAKEIILGSRPVQRKQIAMMDRLLSFTGPGRSVVANKARASVLKETKGFYPAPLRAIDVTINGLRRGLDVGYAEEATALGDLIATPECKSLVHIFFLSEAAKKLGKAAGKDVGSIKVGVIGAGTMGAGIAASFVSNGVPVVLVDPIAEVLERAKGKISTAVEKRRSLSAENKQKFLSQVTYAGNLEPLREADLIVEAALEEMPLKREIFSKLDGISNDAAILASNTSSLSITEISSVVRKPDRVVGMHFFNPAEKMPLVEIVRGSNSGERSWVLTAALATKIGKFPVVVEDVRGFLVNRILSPYLMEAGILLSQGFSVSEIDSAATRFGMPMGPVRLLDEVGLDVAAKVCEIMINAYGERMNGPRYAEKMVSKKRFGKKSGSGFYSYQDEKPQVEANLSSLLELPPMARKNEEEKSQICDRLILRLVNEAVMCLDEGVAGEPSADAAGQVDLATVMGIGFAPFRGGVIHYAETLGAKTVAERLSQLAAKEGPRFQPASGITKRAERNISFYAKI